MNYFFYTRTENEANARQVFSVMRAKLVTGKTDSVLTGSAWDAMSGQRGFAAMLRWTQTGGEDDSKMIAVDNLSDLGRDVPGLVKQISALLKAGVSVYAAATNLFFGATLNDKEAQVIHALAQAHVRYTNENRKRGIASAREAGATIGRPRDARFQLDAARETVRNLTDANTGRLPSTRKLAAALGCGNTKASELLREYSAEKKLSKPAESGES